MSRASSSLSCERACASCCERRFRNHTPGHIHVPDDVDPDEVYDPGPPLVFVRSDEPSEDEAELDDRRPEIF